jgi:hypothetical protein
MLLAVAGAAVALYQSEDLARPVRRELREETGKRHP